MSSLINLSQNYTTKQKYREIVQLHQQHISNGLFMPKTFDRKGMESIEVYLQLFLNSLLSLKAPTKEGTKAYADLR